MSKTSKSTSALVVLGDKELGFNAQQLPKLQAAALQLIDQVRLLERQSAGHAIMAGLTLHRVKVSLKFGEFMPWLKANVRGVRYSQCNYYMRLATVFVEKQHVKKPDLLALPGDQTSLAIDEQASDETRTFFLKLSEFVGDRSLNDLLEKYGIKGAPALGGAREKADTDEPAPAPTPEALYLQSRDEIGDLITRAEGLLLRENRLQFLVGHPEEINGVAASLRALADKVEAAAKDLTRKSA